MNIHSFYRILILRSCSGMQTRSQSKQSNNFTHNKLNEEFNLKVNNETAVVKYNKENNVLDLHDSFVPESMRGKGIGHILAENTFNYIDSNNLKMKVTCTFLRKVYEANKNRYKHLIVD